MEARPDDRADTARRYMKRALEEADDEETRFNIRQALQLLEGV